MNKKHKNFYSIREAAHACGIGRTTLQRMSEEGLIVPAEIGENKYHYYDERNIYDINMIHNFSECGFTRKELKKLDMTPEVMLEFADQIQNKINILTFNMENLRTASLSHTQSVFRLINIPPITCLVFPDDEEHTFLDLSTLVKKSIRQAIQRGYTTDRYYPPYVVLHINNYMTSDLSGDRFRATICVPVVTKSEASDIMRFPAATLLSVTYPGKKGDTRKHLRLLRDNLAKNGYTPKGDPLIEALFNPFNYEEDSMNMVALRLGIPIE
ncbi:MAG: MerR family transcriptional regulator [Firmicutes bacterium]|nr:MerR family transcriptional regulator [Bacillota bacterium]